MLMSCASAPADNANDAPSARPMSFSDFMSVLAGIDRYGMHPADRVLRSGPLSADFAGKSPANFGQIHDRFAASCRGRRFSPPFGPPATPAGRLPDRRRGFPGVAAIR